MQMVLLVQIRMDHVIATQSLECQVSIRIANGRIVNSKYTMNNFRSHKLQLEVFYIKLCLAIKSCNCLTTMFCLIFILCDLKNEIILFQNQWCQQADEYWKTSKRHRTTNIQDPFDYGRWQITMNSGKHKKK